MDNFVIFFWIVPAMVGFVFLLVFIIIIASLFQGMRKWRNDTQAPRLVIPVTILARREKKNRWKNRTNISYSYHISSYSYYYVTFEVETGDRMELEVPEAEYGILLEGDKGMLTFQGTRYLGFVRK